MRESFAYSGQIVRHVTTRTKFETCAEDQPDCCGDNGCCDNRGWKLFVVISVGVLAGTLLLAFLSVCVYSAVFHRKKHHGEAPIKASPRTVQPRYTMDTYLTAAGFAPDALPQQGPPISAVQSAEHHAPDSTSSEESEVSGVESEKDTPEVSSV